MGGVVGDLRGEHSPTCTVGQVVSPPVTTAYRNTLRGTPATLPVDRGEVRLLIALLEVLQGPLAYTMFALEAVVVDIPAP
jgi:hypothetical protein